MKAVVGDDDEGGPMLSFFLVRESDSVLATVTTGADGRFALEGTWARAEVEATTADGRTARPEFGPLDEKSVVLALTTPRPALPLRGRVEDESGAPLTGALVEVAGTADPRRVTTGPDGGFDLEDSAGSLGRSPPEVPEMGSVRLTVTLPGEAPWQVIGFLAAGEPCRVVVARDTALRVTLLDAGTGSPVAGARLVPGRPHGRESGVILAETPSVETDAAGRARVPLHPGPVRSLEVVAPGYRKASLHPTLAIRGTAVASKESDFVTPLAPGEERDVVVRLRRGSTVVGRVVHEDGRPAPGARVFSGEHFAFGGRSRAVADADGRFRLEGVLPVERGPYPEDVDVVAALEGYVRGRAQPRLEAESAAGDVEDVGDIVLSRPGALHGRVRSRAGIPVPGARVRAAGATAGETALTDEEGRFVLPVAPRPEDDRDLVVEASADGHQPMEHPVRRLPKAGRLLDLGDLLLAPPGSRRVRVVDPEGRPVAGARVLRASESSSTDFETAPRTDADGVVRLSSAEAGVDYWVRTYDGARFTLWDPTATDPAGDVVVRLPAVRLLHVRVTDEGGAPVPRSFLHFVAREHDPAIARVDVSGFADERGEWPHLWGPASSFTVNVKSSGYVTREVEVPAESPGSIVVVLERFGERHRRRLAEILEETRALESELEATGGGPRDDRTARWYALHEEAQRLRGE
jgi:protocatechuate 3,4-dioxygenase beta subunit